MQRIREIGSGLTWLICAAVVALIIGQHDARADTWVVATVASYHSDRSKNYNEHNTGIGFERDLEWAHDARFVVGVYENSVRRSSTYIGAAFTPLRLGDFHFGVMGGLLNGYGDNYRFFPIALPLMQYERPTWGANLIIAPRTYDTPGVIGLQLKVKF